jgi:hypothetical protein
VGEHGVGLCPYRPRRGAFVKPDTIVGGFVAENAWREERYFDSQKAYEKALDQSGLMLRPRPVSGDRTMDAYTLANAQALVRRAEARQKSIQIDVRTLDETMTVQAEA